MNDQLIFVPYSMKLELLTNATVVDDAFRFVPSEGNIDTSQEKYIPSKSHKCH